ncbi:MAG: hypothetical protein RIC55_24765 [Pirellulaceae bacterium]
MSHLLQMGVDDVYFLVKRLGSDCDDYQQYRELNHNAVEAILRARQNGLLEPDAGEVIWDVDWFALRELGVYRLCVSDNGDGMSADDLRHYINTLSSSSGVQSLAANYGVGAKIAGATRNPAGLVYQSWQNGDGLLAQLVIDDSACEVGFRRWEVQDGDWREIVTDISDEIRPEPIVDHGVSVTLMGTHEYDHTFLGPKRLNTDYKSWWLFRTLNRRYFEVPVTVKVRVFQTWDPDNWPRSREDAKDASLMRTVYGQKYYLDKYAEESGSIRLANANAHFYIMGEKGRDQRQFFEGAGHIAALYQGELYEMRAHNAGRKLLQNFGAVFSAKHIVIYVEPDMELGERMTTNTARTELIVDGGPLPWMEWADEFRENLPGVIKELEHDIAERGGSASHGDSIRERLKKIRSLFKVTRYRPVAAGSIEAESESVGSVQRRKEGIGRKSVKSGGEHTDGRAGNEYLSRRKDGGDKARAVRTHSPEPETRWVSIKESTREQGDMEDRAARYLRGEHLILINADFRVFTDLVNFFKKSYSGVPGAENAIVDVVQEWCEQQLVEAVMGVRAVEGSKLWNQDHIDTALSEEALTVAVMPRYHTWASVKRALGRKLGSLADS